MHTVKIPRNLHEVNIAERRRDNQHKSERKGNRFICLLFTPRLFRQISREGGGYEFMDPWYHLMTGNRRARLIEIFHVCSPISPVLRQKSQLRSLGVICNIILFIFDNKYLHFLCCPRTAHFYNHPVGFSLSVSRDLNHRFLIPLALAFITTSYARGATLRYCQQFLPLYAFLIASQVIAISNMWLN
jgi:hypothetical protein